MHRIPIGIVGTGIMGQRMLAALAPHPRFEVKALWDPQPEVLAQAGAAVPAARLATGLDDLVADPALQVVYIASPPARHLAGVRAALQAGKAVLCEKPLAASVEQAQALRDAVAAAGLPFAVNFPFARSSAANRLLQQWQGGQLGTLQQAKITLRFAQWPRPWQQGAAGWLARPAEGGFTREVLSHFVFLALRLFGPATVQRHTIAREPGQAETALKATLHHAGAQVQIDAEVSGDVADHNRFALVGSLASLALTDWYRLDEGGIVSGRPDPSPGTLDGLAEMLAGASDHRLATADEGLAVVRLVEALLAP